MIDSSRIHPVAQWCAAVCLSGICLGAAILMAIAGFVAHEAGRHWAISVGLNVLSILCLCAFIGVMRWSKRVDWRVSRWIYRKLTDAGWLR